MSRIVILSFILLVLGITSAQSKNQREYRRFVLENQLKVILISDPDLNQSSAALDISVGSLGDPQNRHGMAHFVEHMLFLATEKYPTLNDYDRYLKAHGGYSNAFTAADHTNYHFEISHEGLSEALDRFVQFFISPLLLQEYAEREIHAVNSEHEKNIPQDNWRLIQLRRSFYDPAHPANAFHTGNLETLKGITREELQQFIRDHYTPERMALCVISNQSLEELEKRVRELFSKIPKHPVKPFLVSEKLMPESSALRLVRLIPIKDTSELRIHIPVPSQEAQVRSKTNSIFGMAMGDESAGSLLSLLKSENLATSLNAGLSEDTRFYGSFNVGIELTEKGLANYEQVLEWCFGYLQMMKQSEFPRYLWEENKTMAQIAERFAPKEEGSDLAIKLSSSANQHGLEDVERLDYIYTEPDTTHYFKTLNQLTPEKAVVFLIAKGLETNQVEKYYQSQYSVQEERGALLERLKKAQPHPKLALPKPNPFIPAENKLLPEQPVLLINNAQTTLWYLQDTEFGHPKVSLYFHILSPVAYNTVRNAVLTELYTRLIQEQLNEYAYPAMIAGLSFNLSTTKQGVILRIEGYSESALKLLKVVSQTLKKIQLSEENFQTVYQKYLLELKNFPFAASTMISREVSRAINFKRYYSPEAQLASAEKLALEDVKQFLNAFYARNHLESFCSGNLSADQAKQAVSELWREMGGKPCSSDAVHQDRVLWLSSGSDFTYKGTLPTNNSCLRIEYTVGTDDLETQAASLFFDQAIRNHFYTEMRTKQMLGYVVFSGSYLRERVQNLFFLIQSGTHPSQELFQRADRCIDEINANFEAILAPQFEAIRQSLIEELSKKSKSVSEKAQKFYTLAFEKEGDFLYSEKLIQAIQKTTLDTVVKLFRKTVDSKSRRRVTILLNAQQHPSDETPASIQDINAFHRQFTFD